MVRNLWPFYRIRDPKSGEAPTYDWWYYRKYGILDGFNREFQKVSKHIQEQYNFE